MKWRLISGASLLVGFFLLGLLMSFGAKAEGPLAPDNKVVIFSRDFCVACAETKAYFQQHQIDYLEYNIDHSAAAAQVFKRLGATGTPYLLINGIAMQGFDAARLEALGSLPGLSSR